MDGDLDTQSMEYAMENTRVLYEPARRIETFGDTRFNFILLAEPMDVVGECRIRTGWVEAQRPKIIRPSDYREIDIEGFGPQGKTFFEWLRRQGASLLPLMQYGFRFGRSAVHEEIIHENIAEVAPRLAEEALQADDPLRAVILGVDDAWEACLLKFTLEMVQKSHEINIFDFRRRGLL